MPSPFTMTLPLRVCLAFTCVLLLTPPDAAYPAAPTVTSISPVTGPAAGGTTFSITGSGFVANATTVTIGGNPAGSVVVLGTTLLRAVTPPGTVGPKDVVATTAGGSGALAGGFTYLDAPTVSSITPNSGPTVGGTPVTVTGTGFVAGATVTVGLGSATNIVVVNPTSLTALTPPGSAGAKDVRVTTGGGSGLLTNGFTYLAPPTVNGITPNAGPTGGGTAVTITGSVFVPGATTVTIGGTPATGVTVNSGTSLSATTPPGIAGPKNVVVATGGGSSTLPNGFTYQAAPIVSSITPASGPAAGGTAVIILGTGFVSAGTSVTIGGNPATSIAIIGPTWLNAVTPAGMAGARDVVVTTAGGSGTLAGGFTYLGATRIIGLSGDLGFGSIPVNTTATRTLTIGNTGTSTLTVSNIVYPVGFSGAWSGTIPAGSSHEVTVTFAPAAATTYSGLVTVYADSTDGANTIAALGVGTSGPPGAFNKASPANGSTGSTSPTLTWGASPNAQGYQYCYDTTNDGACAAWTSTGMTSATLYGLPAGTTYYWQVRATNGAGTAYADGGSTAFWRFGTQASALLPAGDFDGDGKADVAVFRPPQSAWYIRYSGNGQSVAHSWGGPGDIPVPGDYDGDGKTDVAVFRPSDAGWYIAKSSGGMIGVAWGTAGDIPVPADYDGDGKTDVAIFRPSQNGWYVLKSSGGVSGATWGGTGDIPVPADYDGDGKADIAVFRPSDSGWYVVKSTGGGMGLAWGTAGDLPVVGDFDGDGKADVGVFRASESGWYIVKSSTGGGLGFHWGQPGDVPVFGDFDGDRKADTVVFRPSEGGWYVMRSTGGSTGFAWGAAGDLPV